MLDLQQFDTFAPDLMNQAYAVLNDVAALVLVARYALLVDIRFIEPQRRLCANRPVMPRIVRPIVEAPTANAWLIVVACTDECIKRRLCLPEPRLPRFQSLPTQLVVFSLLLYCDAPSEALRTSWPADLLPHARRDEGISTAWALSLAQSFRQLKIGLAHRGTALKHPH